MIRSAYRRWQSAGISVQNFTHIPDGGAVAGGAASISCSANHIPSGGAVTGGAADIVLNYVNSFSHTATGGAVCGGEAVITRSVNHVSTGGAVAGGAADISATAANRNYHYPIGGGVTGGSAVVTRSINHVSTGGAVGGGSAQISTLVSKGTVTGRFKHWDGSKFIEIQFPSNTSSLATAVQLTDNTTGKVYALGVVIDEFGNPAVKFVGL